MHTRRADRDGADGEFGFSAHTSARRSAKEGVLDAPYRGGKGGLPKAFSDALRAYKSPSPGRANSLVQLPYPKAQCGASTGKGLNIIK